MHATVYWLDFFIFWYIHLLGNVVWGFNVCTIPQTLINLYMGHSSMGYIWTRKHTSNIYQNRCCIYFDSFTHVWLSLCICLLYLAYHHFLNAETVKIGIIHRIYFGWINKINDTSLIVSSLCDHQLSLEFIAELIRFHSPWCFLFADPLKFSKRGNSRYKTWNNKVI